MVCEEELRSKIFRCKNINRLTSKQLSTAPCQSDIFSLQAPIFSTQLKATGCSFAPSASSATALEPSTYLENTPIRAASNSPLRHSASDSLMTRRQCWYKSSPMLILIFLMLSFRRFLFQLFFPKCSKTPTWEQSPNLKIIYIINTFLFIKLRFLSTTFQWKARKLVVVTLTHLLL